MEPAARIYTPRVPEHSRGLSSQQNSRNWNRWIPQVSLTCPEDDQG